MTAEVLADVEWLRDDIVDGLTKDGTARVAELGVFTLRGTEITYKPSMALKTRVSPLPDEFGLDDDDDEDDEDDDNALFEEIIKILRAGRTVKIPGVGELFAFVEGHLRSVAFRPSPELVRALGL